MRRAGLVLALVICMAAGPGQADYETATLIRGNNRALRSLEGHRAAWTVLQGIAANPEVSRRLLNWSLQTGIDWLFVSMPALPREDHGFVRRLVSEAHQNGIQVFALAGNPTWPANPGLLQAHMREVIAYQQSVNPGEWLDGVIYDLTSYFESLQVLSPEVLIRFPPGTQIAATVGDQLQPVPLQEMPERTEEQMRGLASFIDLIQRAQREAEDYQEALRSRLTSPNHMLKLGVVLPYVLTDPLTVGNVQKPFYQHVVDAADFLVVRSYADRADRIRAAVTEIVTYAGEVGKQALAGIHTRNPGNYPLDTSFFDEDQKRMEQELARLIEGMRQDSGFKGIAIYETTSYAALPEDRFLETPEPGRQVTR